MKEINDNFSFFVDEVTLEKAGTDEKGREIMKVGGIATTKAKDTDGEEIQEAGWDVDYFLNSGFFNYNHQAKFNPKAVIGEPTKAKVTKDGIYVEGYLYNDSDLAKSVYDTTKMLESSSGKRRMGFSIEGKALERDPFNQKKITKARLTGCALTLNPKNPNTLVNIIKGDCHDDAYDYEDDTPADLEKSEEYIVHLEKDGKLVQVDKDLNIKITEIKAIEKGMSVENSPEVTVESVDQDTKDKIKLPGNRKNLTKGEVYSEIFDYIYDVDLEKADMMYQIIEATAIKRIQMETNNKVEKPEITKDDLQKSLDIVLGTASAASELSKSEDNDLEKGKTSKSEEAPEEDEASYDEKMEKAMSEDDEYQKLKKAQADSSAALDEYESKIEKGEVSGYPTTVGTKAETMQADENAASIGKEGDFIKKSEDAGTEEAPKADDLQKSEEATIEKSETSTDDLMKSVTGAIEKGFGDTAGLITQLAEITSKVIEKNDDLEKGLDSAKEDNAELKKSLDATLEEVKKIGNTPIPSRTVTSQNYREHPSLEKSMDGGNVLHAAQNKQEILNILDKKAGLDGASPNMMYAQSMAAFESSGVIEKSVVDDLQKSEGIEIVGL